MKRALVLIGLAAARTGEYSLNELLVERINGHGGYFLLLGWD